MTVGQYWTKRQRYRIALQDLGASVIWELGDERPTSASHGSTCQDTSGNTFRGLINGNVKFTTEYGSPLGSYYAMFSDGQFIESLASFDVPNGLTTLVAWVKLHTASGTQTVVSVSDVESELAALLTNESQPMVEIRAVSNTGSPAGPEQLRGATLSRFEVKDFVPGQEGIVVGVGGGAPSPTAGEPVTTENVQASSTGLAVDSLTHAHAITVTPIDNPWYFLTARFISTTVREAGVNGEFFDASAEEIAPVMPEAKLRAAALTTVETPLNGGLAHVAMFDQHHTPSRTDLNYLYNIATGVATSRQSFLALSKRPRFAFSKRIHRL